MDFTLEVSYQADIEKVKSILQKTVEQHHLVLIEPAPSTALGGFGDNVVTYYLWVWCNKDDYWTVYFEILENIKSAFNDEGIIIPYPQLEVHYSGKHLKKTGKVEHNLHSRFVSFTPIQ